MVMIGLTGGIATGKTHVAHRLRAAGVPIVDADVIARELVQPGQPLLHVVRERFGDGILTPAGGLDRPRLADLVFRDPAARHDLEAILHPAIRRSITEFFRALPGSTAFAVADIPLLFETGREKEFDKVVVVACEPETQIARVIARDGLSRADAERRLTAQLPIADKVRRADYVIRTDGDHAATNKEVDRLLDQLGKDFGRGLPR
jgi:dephospho-CoA kinase